MTTITGSTRRITFQVPGTIQVSVPTAYQVTITGVTTTGGTFVSGNSAALTVNPPSAIASISPAQAQPGETVQVTIKTLYTDLLQGATQASFGPGVAVGNGASGDFGFITVTSKTSATATLKIAADAVADLHNVTVRTGVQQASQTGAFTIATTTNRPPVANAGPAQTVHVGQTVQLDGSASSDLDGNTLTFAWQLLSVPTGSTAALQNADKVNPTFVVDHPGQYQVQLTVSDGIANSSDTVIISTINSAPVANAGHDQTAFVNNTVTLDGSGSSDVDGDPLTYQWTLTVPAGSTAQLSDATAIMPTFAVDKDGIYTATLVVFDGQAHSASSSVRISIANSAPVANAGPDQSVHVSDTVTLDGSGSTDVDGNQLSYTWSFTTVPTGSVAAISDVHAVRPTFTVDVAGVYVAQLIVSDGSLQSTDTVMIATVNAAPVANAGPDQTVPVGTVVNLAGSGTDADHDPLTFAWSLIAKPNGSGAFFNSPNIQNPSFTVDLPGAYIGQLVVNDGRVDSAPDKVVITTSNSRPVADAGLDQSVLTSTVVQLTGNSSHDADSDPLKYSWSFLSVPPGSKAALSDSSSVAPTFVPDVDGHYVAQLIVNDGQLDSTPDTVTIAATSDGSAADLEIFLGVPDNAVVGSGSAVRFSAVVINHGPATANGITATFKLPSGYTVIGGSAGLPVYDGSTGLWTIGTLGSGSSAGLLVDAVVNVTGLYDVTASITSSSAPDPNPGNNSVSGVVVPNRNADLALSFFGVPDTPPIGQFFNFSLLATNNGPSPHTGQVTVEFKLPSGYSVSAVGGDGTYDAGTGIWTIPNVQGSVSLGMGVTVNRTGAYDLSAAILSSEAPDPVTSNNTVTHSVVPNRNADLSIALFPPQNPPIGSAPTLGVRLTNNGPSPSSGVKVHFKVPAGYTMLGNPSPVGTYDPVTGDWAVGALPLGFFDLAFQASVNPTGPYDLSAAITASDAPDPNLADNSASVSVTPNRNADLSLSFFNPPSGTVLVGSNAVFFLEVRNNGPASTTNVAVGFKIPAGYTFANGGPQVGTYDPTTGVWAIGPMISGSLARLILSATVNSSGPLNLVATITNSDGPDPNLADNSVTAAAPNRPPVAVAGQPQNVATASTVTVDGSASSDPDNDPITFAWSFTSRAANSTATISNPNAVSPTFVADQEGVYTLRLIVTDSKGVASPKSDVTISATALNHPPVIISTPGTSAFVGQLYGYTVRALDPDAGDILTFSLPSAPAGMTIIPNSGAIQWTPTAAEAGTQNVTVRVQDQGGFFGTQSFTVEVSSPSEHAPVAVDDSYATSIAATLGVNAPGVLGNDSDPDGNAITPVLLTNPSSGALNFSTDGSFTYTPHRFNAGSLVFEDNVNLAQRVPGVIARASSSVPGHEPNFATDEKLYTFWQAFDDTPFLEIAFPNAVTVTQVRVRGTHDPSLERLEFNSGIIQLFDASDTKLFDSGVFSLIPTHDADIDIPNLSGVRRVRFTPTADAGPLFSSQLLGELKVIGSALVQRPKVVEKNLVQLLPTTVRASNSFGTNIPENAIDDLLAAGNWFGTTTGDFFEVEFPLDTTVNDIETFAASGRPDGFGTSLPLICFGFFQAFDVNGQVLFDSGVVNWPDTTLRLPSFHVPLPNVSGVRRVRYTNTSCPNSSFPPGFSEFRVFGTAPSISTPAFSTALKFQALVGRQVHSTTMVAFLTDDNHDGKIDTNDVPDIIVPVESVNNQITGEIKAISGKDGHELFTAGGPDKISPWSEIAVGDINGDGLPEIIAVASDGQHLLAFDHTGQLLWTSDPNPMPFFNLGQVIYTGSISIANLDGLGLPEIVIGASVFDSNGHLLGDGRDLGGTTGGGATKRAAISAIVDLDLDGTPEIIAGPTAYKLVNGQLTKVWQRTDRPDGFVGIANFDDDPYPEIVIVAKNQIYMLNHDGTDAERWNPPTHAPITLPDGGDGGAPNIGDVNGDGLPEIGIAGQTSYMLFNADGSLRWKSATSDHSSHSTGSTMFDFDRDGTMEIVYRDELSLRVYRGADGVLLMKVPIGSSTWTEEPVVADVDNDGHADIIVSSNMSYDNSLNSTGVYVLQDIANKWVRTRRVWNEHSYHVTNVKEDSTIPLAEQPAWLIPGLNLYRSNAFIPGETPSEDDSFTYKVTDGTLESSPATVRINIRPVNTPPHFTSTAPTAAATGLRYVYGPQAVDPDAGDVLTYSLPTAPAGMTIDANFGLIQWTPTAQQTGTQTVTVKVHDSHGASALQMFSVNVSSPVTVPDVIGQTESAAQASITGATLAVGTINSQNSPTVPAGIVLAQTPAAGTAAVPGSPVSILISLGPAPLGNVPNLVGETQSAATTDITAASFTVGTISIQSSTTVPLGIVLSQTPAAGSVAAIGSPISLLVSSGPPPADIDQDGDGFTPAQGDCNDNNPAIHPGAFDIPGDGIDQDCNGVDAIVGDITPPVAVIASPVDDSVITMPVDIVGTVNDDHLLRYKLEYSSVDSDSFVQLATGITAVNNSALGRMDPTLLENGFYRVRLTAEDHNGQITVDEKIYQVDGQAKIGALHISYIDLTVPVGGIPISIIRTYDSRVKTQQDFGVGWSLEIKSGFFQHNRILGEGWQILSGGSGLPCQVTSQNVEHLTQVRLSDFESYTFAPTFTNLAGATGGCVATAGYRFVSGRRPGATLEILDGIDVFYLNGGSKIVYVDTFLPFNPTRLRLTTADGRVFELDRTAGVTKFQDQNGNSLTITSGGIIHSSGKSVAFARDDAGRITQITDPKGQKLQYAYNGNGDLNASTDQGSNETTFTYDTNHNLIAVHDPLGRQALTNVYDSDGRLIAVVDANGKRTDVLHDLTSQQETVTDARGSTVIVQYDNDGNIVQKTDPLGGVTNLTYDSRDNLVTETDPLGNVRKFAYDDRDNVTSYTDPLGNTRTYIYDAQNHVTQATDPLGHSFTYAYDRQGNLVQKSDPLGRTTSFTYDEFGNVGTVSSDLGQLVANVVDPEGHVTQQTDGLGNVSFFSYDANGNQDSQNFVFTDGMGTPVISHLDFAFDPTNRLQAFSAADGGRVRLTRDGEGNMTAITDRQGRTTTYEFDNAGHRVKTTYPDGALLSSVLDANGNQTKITDLSGNTTQYEYDALDRPIRVTHADGTLIQNEYDADGRLVARTDENGHKTTYTYDAAGRKTKITDALGNSLGFTYDAAGNLITQTDANGNPTKFEYNAARQKTKVTYPDGTFETFTYDQMGRMVTKTDPERHPTSYEYDLMGGLTKITDAAGEVTTYSFNERGDAVAQTDASGHVTKWAYDSSRRITQQTLPLGMGQSFTYAPNGQVATKTDYAGKLTSYSYGESGPTKISYPDGSTVEFTYAADGRRMSMKDSTGTTQYTYDSRRRLTSVTSPNGSVISYSYDPASNLTSITAPSGTVRYGYDAADRLTSVEDPDGNMVRYSRDASGNIIQTSLPNGVTSKYQYDLLNRITNIAHLAPDNSVLSSFRYQYGAAGERVGVTDASGVVITYGYDPTYRLISETTTPPGGQGVSAISYSYDAVGNRLARVGPVHTDSYAYDINDRLLSDGISTYEYDLNGNLTKKSTGSAITTFGYDGTNLLNSIVQPNRRITYGYDGDGARVMSSVDGIQTTYLQEKTGSVPEVMEERDPDGTLLSSYVRGAGLLSQKQGTTRAYFLRDGLDSTTSLTDTNGAIINTYAYDTFGNVNTSTRGTEFLYAGQQYDGDAGLYFLRARYYDPTIGRFTASDRFPSNRTEPRTLHRFAYCGNNPVNCIDPTGNEENLLSVSTAAAIAGVLTSTAISFQANWTYKAYTSLPNGVASFQGPADAELFGYSLTLNPAGAFAKLAPAMSPQNELILRAASEFAGTGGIDVLHPRLVGDEVWVYGYAGASVSVTNIFSSPSVSSLSYYEGVVYQLRVPESYTGDFVSVSVSALVGKLAGIESVIGSGAASGSIFSTPGDTTGAYGFSAGPTLVNGSYGLSAAYTYYFYPVVIPLDFAAPTPLAVLKGVFSASSQ